MKKIYTHNQVTFTSAGPRWKFTADRFEYVTPLPGGRATAERVARVVSGSLARTNGTGLDNLGRANINTIIEKAQTPVD